jgi:type III restriction enzyme
MAVIENPILNSPFREPTRHFKFDAEMATGSGKTVVMAMLIAWQALNKLEDRQDARFSDAFLIVTPGITIRDRLRVLLPTDTENYYRQRDVLPSDLLQRLTQARILITNSRKRGARR